MTFDVHTMVWHFDAGSGGRPSHQVNDGKTQTLPVQRTFDRSIGDKDSKDVAKHVGAVVGRNRRAPFSSCVTSFDTKQVEGTRPSATVTCTTQTVREDGGSHAEHLLKRSG